ncbi:MAG: YigZ family protein [Bacteroidales bacterium]|nr:YigZ family protein [Bacteroidales bacterium]
MESDSYISIKSFAQGIYKEKGSRFLSFAFPVSNQDEVKPIIDKIRKEHHEARHHCFAYMIGHERALWRTNDDGEPSGTAGRPILGQINSYGLTNILIVVSRYFGGTLLGVSGLINAYRTAAASAIDNSEIIECTLREYYEITYPYIAMNDVMKILKEENIGQSDQTFDLDCRIILNFRASSREKILGRLSRVEGLKFLYIKTV